MKLILLALALLLALQSPAPMPEPGNPGHQEPAIGASCVHEGPGVSSAQACACKPVCMEGHDQEGNPDGTVWRQEDAKCRAYCFKDHCHCQSDCEP